MTFMFVVSRHWQGFDLRLGNPRYRASWLVLGWLALAYVPGGRIDITYCMMTRKGARGSEGVTLFVAFDSPFQFFGPRWGYYTVGVCTALTLPLVSIGAQFVGWPLAVNCNYR